MPGPDLTSVVFRVLHDRRRHQTQLSACELATKQWYETGFNSWTQQREQLRQFGVSELSLSLTDDALANGTRDAQFAAVEVNVGELQSAGFRPITP